MSRGKNIMINADNTPCDCTTFVWKSKLCMVMIGARWAIDYARTLEFNKKDSLIFKFKIFGYFDLILIG